MRKCHEKLGSIVGSLSVAEFKEKLDKCPQKTLKQQAVIEQGWALFPVMV